MYLLGNFLDFCNSLKDQSAAEYPFLAISVKRTRTREEIPHAHAERATTA